MGEIGAGSAGAMCAALRVHLRRLSRDVDSNKASVWNKLQKGIFRVNSQQSWDYLNRHQ
jgi:hypothetical protein